ncbi:hypothetical protein ACP70R_048990 [Stipagrostis hirtigluma subsp. patula]
MASMLDTYAQDLTKVAASGDPVIGREDEISRVISILCRKSKNNGVLVGAAGVGKTAVAEGLAQRIACGEVFGDLAGTRVVELSVTSMLAGARYWGMLEERVEGVLAEAEAEYSAGRRKVVLFVDEIHMLLGARRAENSTVDMSNMLKPAQARGRICYLGATTHDEYQRYFAKDKAFERQFQKVHVAEPSEDATVAILRGLKPSYEKHHGMSILDDALVAAVKLSAATLQDANGADEDQGPNHWAGPHSADRERVDGYPGDEPSWQDERKRLLELPTKLREPVVGQGEAVSAVADAVVASRSGLDHPNQPPGSFLFLGPTGVGKMELAKALAEQLFRDEKLLVRIDMSEFADKSSITRLIGAPPGGLTARVVLFDEVEKADPAVFNLFLQILDDGRLTDGKGSTVDFTNTIIIMTSNLGAHHLHAGAAGGPDATRAARQRVLADVRAHFRPELINRLDEMVVFDPLSGETLRAVARMQLTGVNNNDFGAHTNPCIA